MGRWARCWAALATSLFLCSCGGKSVDLAVDAGKNGAAGRGGNAAAPAPSGTGVRTSGPSGKSGTSKIAPACSSDDVNVSFAPDAYSAYIDGSEHVFQVPLLVVGYSGPTSAQWTVSDPSAVQVDPGADPNGGVLVTTLRAGDVVITANAGGRCSTVTLHVTAATEAQWQAGNARYNDMNPLSKIETDGGVPVDYMNLVLDPPGRPPACTNCHGATATSTIFRAKTFTPEDTAGFSDQQLIDIVTKGDQPPDGLIDYVLPESVRSFFHTWSDITGEEAQDMVVYLRSLGRMSSNADFGSFTPPGVRDGGR